MKALPRNSPYYAKGMVMSLKIGLYGGSFCPVHNGHIANALDFYDSCALDALYIIPSFRPPHKEAILSDNPADRLNMLIEAFYPVKGKRNIVISDYEIRLRSDSYTFYTLQHFYNPNDQLIFLVGTDMLLTLETWFRAEDLFKMCRFAHNMRNIGENTSGQIERQKEKLFQKYGVKIIELNMNPIDVSSTVIRECVKQGKDISAYVPPQVEEYINSRSLYRD